MKKRSIILIIVICIILTILRILNHTVFSRPPYSYDPDKLLNYKEEYTQIAKLCYQDYLRSYKPYDIEYSINSFNTDKKELISYDPQEYDPQIHGISLTDEEAKALQTIDDNFLLAKKNLNCIIVRDNFVSFSTVNGRASFIYSVNDEKPNFINCSYPDERHVYVEKITDNWYYACEQTQLYFVNWLI